MIRKILLALGALLILFIAFQLITFPRVGKLKTENPESTAFMERRQKELRREGKSDELSQTWVSYERISPHLRSAVIVSEDSRFYDHEGVDTAELEKILREAWETKELGRGGSTITQQLAKNLYLSPSRTPWRKLEEIVIAWRMEKVLGKKRILELYLNLVEFGETVYGAEAAARHYFGKSAASLSPAEAALLAGSLPNPRKMNPGNPGPYLSSRRDIILSRMRRWGYMAERSVSSTPAPEEQSSPPPSEEPPDETETSTDDESIVDEPLEPVTGEPFEEEQPLPPDFVPVDPPVTDTSEEGEPPTEADPQT
ncbi:MAG: monofunctional biosynthetic peptidoglycan transglycosylase [Acidobacteria bacterium]|nr:monofunctional biosynthetic peptidoglycan transglycosylase [Acidobacteriota bacterium]